MGTRKAIVVFFGWLVVAFLCVSIVTIYGFGYFEGALGTREHNLLLGAGLSTVMAFVVTVGFAVVLFWGRSNDLSLRGLPLAIAAAVACGLVHALPLASGYLFERAGSWQMRLGVLVMYCIILGGVIAAGLIRFAKAQEHVA